MKILIYNIITLVFLVFSGCGRTQKIKENKNLVSSDKIENKKTETNKEKRYDEIRDKIDGNLVNEVSPGIIHIKKVYKEAKFDDEGRLLEEQLIVPDRFEFFDSNHRLTNEFDIEKNNPFLRNVPSDITIRKQYANAEETVFYPKSHQTGREKILEKHLWTDIEFQNGFSKVVYSESSIGEYGRILSTATSMVVLDSIGNIIFNHKYPGLASFPVVSRNGKYAIFTILPIETTSNAGIKTQTEGFEIWNTKKNKQVYSERNDNPDMWISGPSFVPINYFTINYTFPNSKEIGTKEIIFDAENSILYSRIFSKKEWAEIVQDWESKYKTHKGLIEKINFDKKLINNE